MDQTVIVTYTEAFIKESVRKQWLNLVGTSGLLLLILLIAIVLFLFFLGARDWFFGFVASSLLIFACAMFFGYFRLRNISMTRFRKMESPTATFRFTDHGISIVADTGKSEVAWKLVEKVIQAQNVWIILVAGGGITLPVEALDDELRAYILERAASSSEEKS